MNRLDNTLDFQLVFGLYDTRVDFLRMDCRRFPWVAEAGASAGLPLQSIVKEGFLSILNADTAQLPQLSEAISLTASRLSDHLRTEFTIYCDSRLHFTFEEQKALSAEKFAARMGIENADAAVERLAASSPLGAVTFKSVEEISKAKAEEIGVENFGILNPNIEVYPGREIAFVATSKEPVICREFRLFCREHEVLRHETPVHFDAMSKRTVRLPSIPVTMYRHLLWEQNGQLRIQLVLEGRNKTLDLPQRLIHQEIALTRSPAAVFLDVGSSLTKFLLVELDIKPTDTPHEPALLADKLRARLNGAASGSDRGVFLEGPHPSTAFVEKYGLSHTPKEKLDEYDDVALAAHLASSLSGLAERLFRNDGHLVSDVYWAFPNTKERNFETITRTVNAMAGGNLLGKARIVPESECLRSAFSGSLHSLALAAKNVVEQKGAAEKENQKIERTENRIHEAWYAYQQRPWYERAGAWLTGSAPENPSQRKFDRVKVPTLKDWHREFAKLECAENLSDFLVLDAGGYSLDVFATFAGSQADDMSMSVPAGSTVINKALVEEMRKLFPDKSEQYYSEKAERTKKQICSEPKRFEGHALHPLCKETTFRNYGSHIESVLDWVESRVKGKGFPIILTGGGGRNQFLQQLLIDKLAERSLATVPINSPLLYSTLRTQKSEAPELMLFLCMASAFHPEEEIPRMAPLTDILGGLAQLALRT
jgi:hypothetical protein